MKITIDTDNLSELDINMLAFLAENGEVAASEPAPAAAEPPKAQPKKAEPKKAEPKPEPEAAPEEPEEDLLGGEAPTMSDAVAAATALVSSGNAAKVKEALAKVGDVKRVSELKDDQIQKFLTALEG